MTGGSFLLHDRCNWNGSGNDDILTDSNTIIWNHSGDDHYVEAAAVDNSGVLQGTFITQNSGHSIGVPLVASKVIIMEGLTTDDA